MAIFDLLSPVLLGWGTRYNTHLSVYIAVRTETKGGISSAVVRGILSIDRLNGHDNSHVAGVVLDVTPRKKQI